MDRTFVMVKPDGVLRGLCGEVVTRLEGKGLKLVAARLARLPEERVMDQYREHVQKPFFPSLKSYIMSGPCLLMVWVNLSRTQRQLSSPKQENTECGCERGTG